MAEQQNKSENNKGERIAKRMSRAGLCSRREAERWIADGRVSVNGKVIDTPATLVSESDDITIDKQPIPDRPEPKLYRFNKPGGVVTTTQDERGRKTVFDVLAQHNLPRLVTIGRLDINTEGLLLMTNDTELATLLERPETAWVRRYKVRAYGIVDEEKLKQIQRGATVDGIKYAPAKVEMDRAQGHNQWLHISLTEGKNREVKHLLEYCGLKVNRLIRLSFGPFQLGKLEKGALEEVKRHVMKEQIPGFAHRLKEDKRKKKSL